MGEPLGDGATRREVGGKVIYGGGGGGGNPEKQTQIVDLPEWAKPYAKESLGKASALSASPYQAYGGERFAQFNPLQKQAFDAAAQQDVAGQIGQATGLAGLAGTSSFRDQGTAQGLMSPYMQNVVDQQMTSAQRQADIASTQRGAQAVRAGAFGGSRQAVENAEAARALASQKGEIQAKGLQSAYEQAQNQFNQEQGQRLNAAQALGSLGTQQFGQQMDITGQQQQFGGIQRQATQDILGAQYQDFLNQQRAPYDQLAFMTSMIRGTPMGQTTTMYQPAPSQTSQLVGLATAGAGAYGAYQGAQGRAAGGEVKGYAAGGITSLLDDVDSLSDEQLGQMQQGEQRPLTAAAVAEEIMRRQAVREGMAQQQAMMAPPPQTTVAEEELAGLSALPAPNLEDMGDEYTAAGGGIVAFEGGGTIRLPAGTSSQEAELVRMQNPDQTVIVEGGGQLYRDIGEGAKRAFFYSSDVEAQKARAAAAANPSGAPVAGISQITPSATRDEKIRERQGRDYVAPTTKEDVDRETSGAAPAGGLGALVNPRGFYDKNRQDIEALGAEEKAFAEQEAEALRKDQEAMGERGAERKKRIEEDVAGLKGKKDQNFNMALIEAGLAMMAGNSANAFENIGKGALIGTKAFTEGTERLNREKARLDDALSQLEDLQFSDAKADKAELRKAKGAVKQAEIGTKKALANLGIKETETVVDLYKTGLEIGSRERIAAATAAKRGDGSSELMDAYLKQYLPKFAGTDALGNTMKAPSYEEYLRTIGIYNRPTEGAKVLPAIK
jgi:hypothetical protein